MIKNNPILSIVIPVYNIEKYIGECFDSLLEQDIDKEQYEILCICDKSQDNTDDVIKHYTQFNRNIIFYESDTKIGGAEARNVGLDMAKGDYVWFLDGDDYVHPNCFHKLLSLCQQNSLDLILFNFAYVDQYRHLISNGISFCDSPVLNGSTYIYNYFYGERINQHLLGYQCRAIVKRTFLMENGFRTPNIVFADTTPLLEWIFFSKSIMSISDVVFYYRQHSSSICGQQRKHSGKMIYGYSFVAGRQLKLLAEKIYEYDKDVALILEKQVNRYFSSFLRPLILADFNEKIKFYDFIGSDLGVKNDMQKCGKFEFLFLNRSIGLLLSVVLKPIYIVYKKLR